MKNVRNATSYWRITLTPHPDSVGIHHMSVMAVVWVEAGTIGAAKIAHARSVRRRSLIMDETSYRGTGETRIRATPGIRRQRCLTLDCSGRRHPGPEAKARLTSSSTLVGGQRWH